MLHVPQEKQSAAMVAHISSSPKAARTLAAMSSVLCSSFSGHCSSAAAFTSAASLICASEAGWKTPCCSNASPRSVSGSNT